MGGRGPGGTSISGMTRDTPIGNCSTRPCPTIPWRCGRSISHTLWTNAHGLEIAGIDDLTADPFGGEFVRDDEGWLTGLVREDATDLVARYIPEPTREEQVERLDRTQEAVPVPGTDRDHDFDSIASTLGWYDLREADQQHIRVTKYLRGPEVPWAMKTGWHTGDGDDWLHRGGLKLFSDGALGSHTSHMSSPFPDPNAHDDAHDSERDVEAEQDAEAVETTDRERDDASGDLGVSAEASEQEYYTYPGTLPEEALSTEAGIDANYGIAQMSEDDLFDNARLATEAGISVAIHAIGDQANHHVLNVFERLRETTKDAEERFERPLRHRVEHAQFIQPDDVARFAELDVIASMQPRHCISDLRLFRLHRRIGPTRRLRLARPAERGSACGLRLRRSGRTSRIPSPRSMRR